MFTIALDDYAWERAAKYSFKTEKISCDISLSVLIGFQVLYEEVLFHPSNNLFEYNIPLIKCGYGKEVDQTEKAAVRYIVGLL